MAKLLIKPIMNHPSYVNQHQILCKWK